MRKAASLITELPINTSDGTPDSAWFLNPFIAHAVTDTLNLFPPIPSYDVLDASSYPPFEYNEISSSIQQLLEHDKVVSITGNEIYENIVL